MKKQQSQRDEWTDLSKLMPAQGPHGLPSPQRHDSSVVFSQEDQWPSAEASSMVTFGGSGEDAANDSMSLTSSNPEDCSGSVDDPSFLPPKIWRCTAQCG